MIKIFGQTDKTFLSNGDIVVKPLKAKVTKKDNSDFYLDLEVGLEYIDYIVEGNIVVADTPQGSQAFRVTNPIKTKTKITTKALHVSYDARNYLIEGYIGLDKNCQQMLDEINAITNPESIFELSSNILYTENYNCIRKSLYDVINELATLYDGHLVRDNFAINIVSSIGQDNGVTIEYKKNLQDITYEEKWDDVVTQLLPVGKDGIMLNSIDISQDIYVYSTIRYLIPYTKTVEFNQEHILEDDFLDQEGDVKEEEYRLALIEDLRQQANKYVNENSLPKINYTLKANLDNITDIGDVIEVKDSRLGINITTNVIAFQYDCILNKYTQIEFGNFKNTLSNLIPAIASSVNKSLTLQTQNYADLINKSIEDATNDIWNAIDNSPSSSAENSTTYNITGSGTYPRIMKYNESKLYVWLDDRYRVIENGEVSNSASYFTHREGSSVGVYNGESDATHTITDIANAFGILSPNNDGRVVVFFRCHGTRNIVVDGNTITIPYYSIRAKVSDTNGVFNDYSGQSTVMWSTEIDEDTRNNIYIENNKLMCEYYSSGGTISVWEPWAETGINYVVFSKIRHNTDDKLFPINCEAYPYNYTDTCQDIYKQPYVVTGGSIARKSGVTLSYVIHGYTQTNMDGVVNPKSRVGMISFAKLKDGSNKHIAVVEDSVNLTAMEPRPMCVQYLYTNEMTTGTWSPSSTLKTLFMPDIGERRGAPFVTTLNDGRVAISFMSSQEFKGIKRTDGATENNRVIDIFVSKVPITYNMILTDDLFVKLNFFEFSNSQWGKWGAVQNIDYKLYKSFTYGINVSESESTRYGNVVIYSQ